MKCAWCPSTKLVRETGYCKVCWQFGRANGVLTPEEKPAVLCRRCKTNPAQKERSKRYHCEPCITALGGQRNLRRALGIGVMKSCACGCGQRTRNTYSWGHHTKLFTPEEQRRRAMHNTGDAQRDSAANGKTYRKLFGRHEHRLVAESALGRTLSKGEVVHHKNEDKRGNRKANLEVTTRPEHVKHHIADMLAARKKKHGY